MATSQKMCNHAKTPRAVTHALIASLLSQKVFGVLTTSATVTAESWYSNGLEGYNNCYLGLVDGIFVGSGSAAKCCLHTANPPIENPWLNIDMGGQTVVDTVFIFNREDAGDFRINGTEFYVGDSPLPINNIACGANPRASGVYSCGGKVGRYLGMQKNYKETMHICQIRAYSYKANGYTNYQYLTAKITNCPGQNLMHTWSKKILQEQCLMTLNSKPIGYYNVVFDEPRYVHAVTIVGNSFNNFEETQSWKVSVGDFTESQVNQNQLFGLYRNFDFDRIGKEIKIGQLARSVAVYRDDGNAHFTVHWIGVFSTKSDCSASFDWSGSQFDWRIPIKAESQVITAIITTKIDDCAVFLTKPRLSDGQDLPSFITYDLTDVKTLKLTVNVGVSQAPVTKKVKVCANLNDKVTAAKSDCKEFDIQLASTTTTLAFVSSTFNYDAPESKNKVLFDFPAVSWTPNTFTQLVFVLEAPAGFLSLQAISSLAKGILKADVLTVFNYQLKVTDTYSGLTATLTGTITVYNLIQRLCKVSTLLPLETKLPDFNITVNQQNVQSFTLPEIQDQSSQDTGDSTGLLNCGPRVYSFIGNQSFLFIPDPLKPREMVVSSNTPKNVGFYSDVAVSVTLRDYPQVAALMMPFTVRIQPCVVVGIAPRSRAYKPSAMYIVSELPHKIQFTRYITVPDCFYAASEFEYQITLADGNPLPKWASLDQSGPLLELYLQESATDKTIEFMYSANLTKLETSISIRFTLELKTGNKDELEPVVEKSEAPISKQETEEPSEAQSQQKAAQKDPDTAKTKQSVFGSSDTVDSNAIKVIYSAPIQEYVNYLKATSNVDSTWTGWTELLNAKQNKKKKSPNQILIAPTARISQINTQGVIEIKFSKPMLMLKDLNMLFTIENGRQLQTSKSHEMNAHMIPGFYSDAKNLQFNYTAEFKDNQTLQIQMLFYSAEYVSSQFYEDRIMVKLSRLLLDAEDGLPLLPESRKLEKPVPPQMVLGASAMTVQVLTTSIQVAATTAVAGNAALNMFLQGSLNQLWGMINNIQMIVVTPLLNIQFPGNALNLYMVMIQIATFDILPTEKFYPKILPLPDSDNAFNDRFENLGFESTYFVGNFGSALIGIFWIFLLYLTYPLVCYLAPSARFIEKYRRELKKQLFWNGTILFLQEAYLDILVCVFINIRAIKQPWVTWTVGLSVFLTVLLLASSIFLPLFIFFYLRRNFGELRKPAMKERFESAYEMINLKQGPNAILWAVLFFLRRAILAFTLIFSDYSAIHLMAFVYPAVMTVIWLGQYHPLATPFDNKLELYDACSTVMISYCLFLFTDFVPDAMMRYKIGWVMLLFTLQNILVNLYLISKQPILKLLQKVKSGIQNRKALQSKMSLDQIGKKSVNFLKKKTEHWKKRIFEEDSPLETINEVSEKENSISDSSIDDEEEQKAIQLVYAGIKITKKRDEIITDSDDSNTVSQTPNPQSVLSTYRKEQRPKKSQTQNFFNDSMQSESRKVPRNNRKTSQTKLIVGKVQSRRKTEDEDMGNVITDNYRQTVQNLKQKAARMSREARLREQRLRTNRLLKRGPQFRNSIDYEVDLSPKHDNAASIKISREEKKQSPRQNERANAMKKHQIKNKVYEPQIHLKKLKEQQKQQSTQLLQNWQLLQPGTLEMPVYKPSYTKKAKEEKKLLWQQYLNQQIQKEQAVEKWPYTEMQSETEKKPDLEIDIAVNMIMFHQRLGKKFKEPEEEF